MSYQINFTAIGALLLGLAGYAWVWQTAGWQIATGIFLIQWSNNFFLRSDLFKLAVVTQEIWQRVKELKQEKTSL